MLAQSTDLTETKLLVIYRKKKSEKQTTKERNSHTGKNKFQLFYLYTNGLSTRHENSISRVSLLGSVARGEEVIEKKER